MSEVKTKLRKDAITTNGPSFIDQKSISAYLREVREYGTVISKEEEDELTERLLNGDEVAKEKLIYANLRFVLSIAKTYQNNGIAMEDLISEGNLGLIKATERFDRSKGHRFISYAVWWIRQSIIECINEHSRNIRIPVNQINDYLKLKRDSKNSDEEISNIFPTTQSIFDVINDDGDEYVDVLEDKNTILPDEELDNSQKNLKNDLDKLLSKLSDRDRLIIEMYYGLNGFNPSTLEDIGDELNLTRERIRQVKAGVLLKIRSNAINLFNHIY